MSLFRSFLVEVKDSYSPREFELSGRIPNLLLMDIWWHNQEESGRRLGVRVIDLVGK